MEKYTMFPKSEKDFDGKISFKNNKELDDKLSDEYVIKKIVVNFDHQIEKMKKLYITYRITLIPYLNFPTFYNNQYTFICYFYMNYKVDIDEYLAIINFDGNDTNNIISVDIFIEKPQVLIQFYDHDESDMDNDNNDSDSDDEDILNQIITKKNLPTKLIIRSNYFKNIDELVNYFCNECYIKYEDTKKYILRNNGSYKYLLYDYNVESSIIYQDDNFIKN